MTLFQQLGVQIHLLLVTPVIHIKAELKFLIILCKLRASVRLCQDALADILNHY